MTDIQVTVRSNIDALSASKLHDALKRMVSETVSSATDTLRADRLAHSRSGATLAHIRSEKTSELANVIEGKLGITPVTEKDERPTNGLFKHSQAPMFVDGGTSSPIFAKRAGEMWNMGEGIFGRKTVRGQHPQHFMAKVYGEAQMFMRSDPQISLALKEMQAEADAMLAAGDR